MNDSPASSARECAHCAPLREQVTLLDQLLASERAARQTAEAELRATAPVRDASSGLPNRTAFLEELSQALADDGARLPDLRPEHVAVMVVQLEDLDVLGSGLGIPAARVLAALAERLSQTSEVLGSVARVGSDELAVVGRLSEDPEHLSRLTDRVENALTQPLDVGGAHVAIRARACLRLATRGLVADQVLRETQGAIYAAGPGADPGEVVLFSSERGRHVAGSEFVEEMRRGLREGHIEAWFQELVDMATGEVVGAEALARWNHPEHGFIPPQLFVQQAEDAHVVDLLTDHILGQACRWSADHPEIEGRVHVNLSAADLADVRLPARVQSALQAAGLDPGRLSLEITERVFVSESPIGFRNLTALRRLGVGLAIDDFGVLYASFAYLRRFPADVIKIDRSFVVDIESDERDREVLRGIVTMARALGMGTIAEGVESEGQARILRDLGVDLAQGWWFGQACPPEEWGIRGRHPVVEAVRKD